MSVRQASFFVGAFVAIFLAGPITAQQGTITGRVLDAETQQPLAAAVVSAGGSQTLTDNQGSFTLTVGAGNHTVTVPFIGHQTGAQVISVAAGETVTVEFELPPIALLLEEVVGTVGRRQSMRNVLSVPAAVGVTTSEQIEVKASTSTVDYVKEMPGVDAQQTGINQHNMVIRGFNNIFSTSLLVLTDNRYARVPSLRLNAYNMIPVPPLDIDRIEVVLGPASALYGPNSANGVMHIITTSPIDEPGTTVSFSGGNRSIFSGAFRQAVRFNEKAGLKVTGQYFRGDDFRFRDPAEVATASNPLIAARVFDAERYGGEARFDLRPWEGSDDGVTLTYGLNQLVNSIELTGVGAGQAKDWKYQYGQVQLRRSGFFVQAFLNASDAGDTYLLRTGQPIVDKSTVFATQAQYAFSPVEMVELVAGVDFSETTPKTEGTITGSNEDADETTEFGGYVSATVGLSERLDLVGALRMDDHEQLADAVWSPRAGLVFEPVEGQAFRATFNRAFSTPSTNNLFLDLIAGTIPVGPVNYNIRALGVPQTGFTWTDECAGGVNNFCMYSPFAPGTQLPATGTALWDGVVVPGILADPDVVDALAAMGLTPAQFATIVAGPTPAEMTSVLGRFNSEDPLTTPFLPDPGVTPLVRILPTITTTYEVGYQALISDRLKLSVSVYRSQIRDFVGPLRVETPSVFLDGTSVASFVETRMIADGVPGFAATPFAAAIAPTAAMTPLGTVAPDQRTNSDLVLTYRNFGDVSLWGTDIGFEAYATEELAFTGSYSWVSKECFDFDADGNCSSSTDIALNAPTNKGSVGFRFDDRARGFVFGARARYTGEFPMNSGVYVGTLDSYTVFDTNVAYRVPGYEGFIVSLTVNNVFDNRHQEFIGAPEMGIVGLLKVQYQLGGN